MSQTATIASRLRAAVIILREDGRDRILIINHTGEPSPSETARQMCYKGWLLGSHNPQGEGIHDIESRPKGAGVDTARQSAGG